MTVRTAAIIGCGDVSGVHFEALHGIDDIELIAVCDTDPAVLARASATHSVPGFSTHYALLEHARPDVVHICTPHDQHAEVAIDCLASGVHVLLEKPLAHSLPEAERIVAAAERSRAQIGVCLQNRYNATIQAAREVLDSGALGAVRGASATVLWARTPQYYQVKPWRGRWAGAGGGLLINQAIHTIDLLQWLLGDARQVAGHIATRLFPDVIEVEDTADILLDHGAGVRSVFFGTLAHVVHAPVTLDIAAEAGSLSLRGDLTITRANGLTEHVPERRVPTEGRSYWGASHRFLIQDFYSQLNDEEPFWISPAEALKSLQIVSEVYAQTLPGHASVAPGQQDELGAVGAQVGTAEVAPGADEGEPGGGQGVGEACQSAKT